LHEEQHSGHVFSSLSSPLRSVRERLPHASRWSTPGPAIQNDTFGCLEVPDDERWMRQALREVARAAEEGEVPVGAVVVHRLRLLFPLNISGKDRNFFFPLNVSWENRLRDRSETRPIGDNA